MRPPARQAVRRLSLRPEATAHSQEAGKTASPERVSTPPRRIAFAGTPNFAATILARMLAAGLPVNVVLTQPDRPAGRGRKLTASPVKQGAEAAGIPVLQPASLRAAAALGEVARYQPDLMVVAAYGLILPQAALDLPASGCLNVHASLLPRWRGAAPVERAIMAGDGETGVCIMQMEAGLDTGPVRLARSLPIPPATTGGELEAQLAELGAEALLEVIAALDQYPPAPQPEAGVCYAHKLSREDARIDFQEPAAAAARRICAMNPSKPVAVLSNGVRIQLLRAIHGEDGGSDVPGTVLSCSGDGIRIACGSGTLHLLEARVIRGKGTLMDAASLARTQSDLLYPGVCLDPA
ncbi:MAG: methionyl-tRNA formyltransferase [Gammaproteobacteria bacterium]|nr:methionyl-tRNA formyltransferase [Gammaproteobacteria bacterium]